MLNRSVTSLVVIGLVAALAGPAAAQEFSMELVPHDDPAKAKLPPDIAVTVISGSAAPPADKISLVQTDAKTPIELKAKDLKTYVQGDETLGIVVVIEAHEIWIGNDSYTEDEASKYAGVYKQLVPALDGLNKAGPSGSKGAIITYSQGMAIPHNISDLATLTGDKIGTQKELGGKYNRDLVSGISEAAAQINKMGTSRKVLVVIGDGMDTNQEAGMAQLADLGKKLANDRVEVYAIFVPAPDNALDADPNGFKKLTKNVQALNGVDGLAAAISKVVDSINDRYYVTFEGADLKLKKRFDWDDKEHEFSLKVDKDEFEIGSLVLPKWKGPWEQSKKGFPWLFVIIPVLLLAVVAVVLIVKRKKPEPEPVYEAPPAPIVATPAAMPAGPSKTVMIGIGGDDQGFPVVGWIVPLNGPNQFQTFKLQGGATKIGTGGAAHIVVNDGYMSTEHAQIVASPAGFVLVDGGSTNGTLVNDRRVDKHELVDNDIFTMGKTNFRFKSIN